MGLNGLLSSPLIQLDQDSSTSVVVHALEEAKESGVRTPRRGILWLSPLTARSQLKA